MPAIVGEYSNDDLLLDQATGLYKIGDIAGVLNGTVAAINDVAKSFAVDTNIGADNMLTLNFATGAYLFGATGAGGNSTRIQIDDSARKILAQVFPNDMLSLDYNARIFQMGDIAPAFNGTIIKIDDPSQKLEVLDTLGGMLKLDQGSSLYQIGDYGGVSTATYVRIDASGSGDIAFIAAGGISTSDPGSGQGQWKLGQVVAGAVALDAANYVEVDIGGSIVKLLKAV